MVQTVNVTGVGQLNFPDEMSQQEMSSAIQKNFPQLSASNSMDTSPTSDSSFMGNVAAGIGKGVTDVGMGVKQRFDEAANYLEEKLGTKTLNSFLGLPNASDILQHTQNAIDEKRRIDAPLMATKGGKTGNFIGQAIPAVAASMVPGGQSFAGSIASGAALGAAEPTSGDESVLKNAAFGAAGGAVGYGISKGISRVINPKAASNPELELLKSEGVQPTLGQTLGGAWNKAEQKLQSVPFLGDAITAARNRAMSSFNNAAINRATAPIGKEIEGAGQSAVKEAGDALSASYNNAINQVSHIKLDNQFAMDIAQLHGMAQNLTPPMRDKFNRTMSDIVMDRVTPQGAMLGETYKSVDSELGRIAAKYQKSSGASEAEFGDAISQLQNLLNQQMRRNNPQVAEALAKNDEGWANLVRIEAAAKSGKNNSGIFTPAQLNMAVQGADDSVRGRAVARGTALMQDLSSAGQNVLGNTVADSGTAGRIMVGAGGLATGLVNPAIPLSLVGASAVYSKPVQSILNALVSARPEAVKNVGGMVGRYASSLGNLGIPAALISTQGYRRSGQSQRDQALANIAAAPDVNSAIAAASDALKD